MKKVENVAYILPLDPSNLNELERSLAISYQTDRKGPEIHGLYGKCHRLMILRTLVLAAIFKSMGTLNPLQFQL